MWCQLFLDLGDTWSVSCIDVGYEWLQVVDVRGECVEVCLDGMRINVDNEMCIGGVGN